MSRSWIADEDLARVDPDPHLESNLVRKLRLERGDLTPQLRRSANGAERIILAHRRNAEYGQQLTADELLDPRAVPLERRRGILEVALHHESHRLRVEPVAERRLGADVAEDQGDCLARFDLGICSGRRERCAPRRRMCRRSRQVQ